MTRTAIYARVSTDDKGQDATNQLLKMPAPTTPELLFVDYATGKNGDRAQYQRMLLAAENKQFDELIFWSLDRLTREGISATFKTLEKLKALNIRTRSIQEPWLDSDSPVNDIVIAVLAWAAKMERIRLTERTKAGMARVKATGSKSGRPIGRPVKSNELRIQCAALKSQGYSIRSVAKSLNVSVGWVHKIV